MAYQYRNFKREHVLAMIPPDGVEIESSGCGDAVAEGELVRQGLRVHGIDLSFNAIAAASERLTSRRVVKPDDRSFFEPARLLGLALAHVIEHLPVAWQALSHFAAFVKPGGWVVISVPNMHNFRAIWTFAVRGEWPEDETGIFDRTPLQVMIRRRLDRWYAAAGLQVDQRFDQYLVPHHPRQTKLVTAFDRLTLWAFHEFTLLQIQARYRRDGRSWPQ